MAETFIDFCAGIGSTRLALEQLGARCAGFSEIDPAAEKTYRLFFGSGEKNFGDLMNIDASDLPDFDIMLGGFPCQSFSIMGQRDGMQDARGKIIFGLAGILKVKSPRYFILENVKGLLSHDQGNTLRQILTLLRSCGYRVEYQLLRSVDFGIPQLRERVFITGTRSDIPGQTLPLPRPPMKRRLLREFLIDRDPQQVLDLKSPKGKTFLRYLNNRYNAGRYTLAELLRPQFSVLDTRQSDLRIYHDVVPTLRTGRHGIFYVYDGQLRALTGMESLLLQGFPHALARLASESIPNRRLLSQAGNAMTVPVVKDIASRLLSGHLPYSAAGRHHKNVAVAA